ncbi:MAG TPA: fibronectin type III domain-containing protein, partial [Streptosporangiaceae bacterium]|nr:fibronectin type III domain-containing protein [Streptosporangiaceae bacterium]
MRILACAVLMAAALTGAGLSARPALASGSAQLLPAAGQFFPVSPVEAMDTRSGIGGVALSPLSANETVTFPVEGVGGVPDNGVSAVLVELSAYGPTQSGGLEDFDPDGSNPAIWTVPLGQGESNTVSDVVQVSASGYVSVTNDSSGTTDASVTVLGYVQDETAQQAGDLYAPLPYAGILDTRSGLGAPRAQIPAGGSLTFQVTGVGGVPADAAGVAVYLGVSNESQSGWVSAFAADRSDPGLRVLSYQPTDKVRNLYVGPLSASGQLTVVNHGSAAVDMMAAVQGYLISPMASELGDTYNAVTPQRIADTRNGTGGVPATSIPAGGSITFAATGVDGVPSSGVPAVVEGVAASNPTATGFLSVYAAGTTDPGNGAVNFNSADQQDNDLTTALVSSVSPTGEQTITNHSTGTVDVVVSIRGYYIAPTGPSAPDQADAGNQNGTATVDWAAPVSDGGAPITSYQVTVYNADGSVNQSVSAGPADTSATISGLSATGSYSASVYAVNPVGSSDAATMSINVVPNDWTTPQTSSLDFSVTMDIDPSTGDLTLDSATSSDDTYASDGSLISSDTVDPASTADVFTGNGIGNFTCVKKTGSGVTSHTPWHDSDSSAGRSFDYMHESYTVKNARQLQGPGGQYETFQDMICSTGGGQAGTNHHLWFTGTAVSLERDKEFKIGHKWGTGESNGSVNTSLNFQLSAGVATVAASIGVTVGGGTYGGDFFESTDMPNYPKTA